MPLKLTPSLMGSDRKQGSVFPGLDWASKECAPAGRVFLRWALQMLCLACGGGFMGASIGQKSPDFML